MGWGESVDLKIEYKFFNLQIREEVDLIKKLNRGSGNSKIITKDLIFVPLNFQRKHRKKAEVKRNKGGKLSKFGKIHNPTDSRC